ncbi:hypothetical protein [Xanthomonas cannabis]|uniref:hypothetical protein n=1 Tax=Xanthomonas cannabis TaxID=1885674 RepID=UPI0033BB2BFB
MRFTAGSNSAALRRIGCTDGSRNPTSCAFRAAVHLLTTQVLFDHDRWRCIVVTRAAFAAQAHHRRMLLRTDSARSHVDARAMWAARTV